MKTGVIIGIVVLVLVVGGFFLFSGGSETTTSSTPAPGANLEDVEERIVVDNGEADTVTTPPPVTGSSIKEFTMTAKRWSFTPGIITVNEGDTVKLTIESIDVAHGFAINAFGINERLNPGQTTNIEFVADEKGTFSFFCSVSCGSGHSTMRGTLIVE